MIIIGIVCAVALVWFIQSSFQESSKDAQRKKNLNNKNSQAINKIQKSNVQEELTEYLKEYFWPEFEAKALIDKNEFNFLKEDPIGYLSVSNEPQNFILHQNKNHINKHLIKSCGLNESGEGFNYDERHILAFNELNKKDKKSRPLFSYRDFFFDWNTVSTKIDTELGTFYAAALLDSKNALSFSQPAFNVNYKLTFNLSSSFAKTYPKSNYSLVYTFVNEQTKLKLELIKENLIKYNKREWEKALIKLADEAKIKADNTIKEAQQTFKDNFIDEDDNILLSPNIYQTLFDANKTKINEEYRDNISDLMKVKSFINTKEQILKDIIYTGYNSDDFNVIVDNMKALTDSLSFQDVLVASGVEFLQALFEDDIIKYHEIKELFDRLGVFNNNWQNDVVNKLSQMDGRLENIEGGLLHLSSTISQFESRFIREIQSLQLISAQGLYAVSNGLEKLGNKMDTSNAIAAVNAYQNYQTKRALKS